MQTKKVLLRPLVAAACAVGSLGFAAFAPASIVYSTLGSTYSQNFDSLATTGATDTWTNDSTLPGWVIYHEPAASPVAITTYAAGDGSSNTGAFYSFGTVSSTDRALGGEASGGAYFGSPASGAVAGWWAVGLNNSTGADISAFTVNFDGEQWRNGGNATAQSMVMEYGFGTDFTTVSSWTPGGAAFNFTSPTVGTTAAALDGNASANRAAGLGGTINDTWANGSNLWVRWIENNDAGNDHGMGIDNFTLTTASVPEPTAIGLIGIGALGLFQRRRRRAH